jgi:hypothetical protein
LQVNPSPVVATFFVQAPTIVPGAVTLAVSPVVFTFVVVPVSVTGPAGQIPWAIVALAKEQQALEVRARDREGLQVGARDGHSLDWQATDTWAVALTPRWREDVTCSS